MGWGVWIGGWRGSVLFRRCGLWLLGGFGFGVFGFTVVFVCFSFMRFRDMSARFMFKEGDVPFSGW